MTKTIIRLTRRRFAACGGAALLWPQIGRTEALEAISGTAFGTSWRLTGPSGSELKKLRSQIETVFAEIDRQMSPWRVDSEISQFNRAAAGKYTVSPDTARVSNAALALADESAGAFDPTVGPLVAHWGFGPIKGSGPDWRGVTVRDTGIAKRENGLTLDLCGIAKGWALDRAREIAQEAGIGTLLMDLGGELTALGSHPSGRDWQVAVEHPSDGPAPAVLRLPSGRAVATSGMKAQSYSSGGTMYGHIIDPRREAPASGDLKSVTVVAETAMQADGWATALFAAGAERGPNLARERGIAALFLTGNDARPHQVRAGGIEAMLL